MRTEEELMFVWYIYFHLKGFSGSTAGKEFTCNAGDPGLTPGSGRCAGEGMAYHSSILGLPLWLSRWRICLHCGRPGFDPWIGNIP